MRLDHLLSKENADKNPGLPGILSALLVVEAWLFSTGRQLGNRRLNTSFPLSFDVMRLYSVLRELSPSPAMPRFTNCGQQEDDP